MKCGRIAAAWLALAVWGAGNSTAQSAPKQPPVAPSEILAASPDGDWRTPDPARLMVMDFADGRVVIELAPRFAPAHVANIEKLLGGGYFDGLSINRVQDNYVTQWGDPAPENARKPLGEGKRTLAAEFSRRFDRNEPFVKLKDGDVYAREVGIADGFPAARDPRRRESWLLHCYGMVGAGRDEPADSGSGAELYVVIGHSPRNLDRNVTLVGRVLSGAEELSALPRGQGALGFYARASDRKPIRRAVLASQLAEKDRPQLQVLRENSGTYAAWTEARRNRRDAWYKAPAGKLDICNAMPPIRAVAAASR
jgi:peptidylprolyl isomerase